MNNKILRPSSILSLATLLLVFLFSGLQESNAQAAPLTITNTTGCNLYVYALAGPAGCVSVGCSTFATLLPAGGLPVTINPCGPATFVWMTTIHTITCAPGLGCPIGRTPNTFTACAGAPWIGFCGGNPVVGIWTTPNSVVFI